MEEKEEEKKEEKVEKVEEKEEDKIEDINIIKKQEDNEEKSNDNLEGKDKNLEEKNDNLKESDNNFEEKDKKSNLNERNDEKDIKNEIIDNTKQKNKENKEIIENINNNKNEIIIIEEKKDKNNDKIIDKNDENINENEEEIKISINIIKKKNNEQIKNNINKKKGKIIITKKKQESNNVFNRLYNYKKKETNIKKDENHKTNNIIKKKNTQKTETLNDNSSEEKNIKKEIKKKKKKNKNHQKHNTKQKNFSSNIIFQNFVNDSKNTEISKKLEQFKQPIIFDDTSYEYSFKPEINQNSIKICQRGYRTKNNSPKNKKNDCSYIENRRTNGPITNILYKEASNKKQRMENIYLNEKKNIKKEVNQSLISKNSVNLLLKKNELKLKQVIEKFSKNNDDQLSIINTIQCLWEINILRELLKNNTHNIEEITLETIKNIIENIVIKKFKGTRIFEEIEFVEQFWIKINPYYENENDFIKKEDLFNYLKILFSLDEHSEINKMIITVEKFLKNINEKENNNENKNRSTYNSLLRDKEYEKKEIWQTSKFIRVFLELKKLSIKYENTKKDKIKENYIKEKEKELTFQPDFNATASYFRKKNNVDMLNTSINSNISNNTNKKKRNFNKLYEEFMLKKQMHERALMILRENKEKRERRMYTDRPSINKYYRLKNRKKTPEIGCSRNEFLYNLNKDILNRKKEKILEKENEYNNKEIYPFRPNIGYNKKFLEGPKIKPRGSEAYIKRNRSVIQFRKREINNYEPIKTKKINISRIKHSESNSNLVHQKEKEEEKEKEEKKEEEKKKKKKMIKKIM